MRQRGFTLVELLVAMTLLVIVTTSLFGTMALTFRAKRNVTQVNDRYHEARQTLLRMTRELRMAFLRAELPEQMREEDPKWITRFHGEADEIYFASTAHLRMHADARESDQSEVSYFLRSDSDSPYREKTLYRRESRRIDDKPERGGTIWPVVQGVKELKLEYWDDSAEIADDAWQSSWDSDSDNEDLLPARVRITLVLEGRTRKQEIRFVTQVAPRVRRPIAAVKP